MINILFRHPIASLYRQLLQQEFPQCQFTFIEDLDGQIVTEEIWESIEILYGSELLPKEIAQAVLLRWIHSPKSDLDHLCLQEIRERENIIVTCPGEENTHQIGEYVIAVILTFAKQFLKWHDMIRENPSSLWDSELLERTWTLENHILLQVGLDSIGTEVVRRAQILGMRVRGMHRRKSFHPYCERVITERELHSVLPAADVVCINLPHSKRYYHWIKQDELELMKEGSILIIVGYDRVVDMEALAKIASTGKFRGIAIDISEQDSLPKNSSLWTTPNVLITPKMSSYPHWSQDFQFWSFCRNLRQYLHGNYGEMKGTIDWSIYF